MVSSSAALIATYMYNMYITTTSMLKMFPNSNSLVENLK